MSTVAGVPHVRETTDLLEQVSRAAALIKEAHEQLYEAVAAARRAGYSYASIGAVLGVTRQAAGERFSRQLDEGDRVP